MSTVIRWNPLREMAALQNTMNRLFDTNWPTMWSDVDSVFMLPIDVYEADGAYTVVANIPGVTQDNINITLNRNVLILNVNVPEFTPQEGQRSLITERTHGQFTRQITLPRPVNNDQVEAVYENGVLTLTLPVAPEAQPKRITVKTNTPVLQSNN
jgi:HSP20 family protein